MALKVNDTVAVNLSYVENTLAKLPSDPILRQTLISLNQLSNTTARVQAVGWMAKPGGSGQVMQYIKLIPAARNHITYHPVFDGPGRGLTIYFYSLDALNSSFNVVS